MSPSRPPRRADLACTAWLPRPPFLSYCSSHFRRGCRCCPPLQAGVLLSQFAAPKADAKSGGKGQKELLLPVAVVDPGAGAVLASKVVAGAKRGAEQVGGR